MKNAQKKMKEYVKEKNLKSFFKSLIFWLGIAYIKSILILLNPLLLHKFIFSRVSENVNSYFRINEANYDYAELRSLIDSIKDRIKETIKKADYQNALYNCIYKKYDNRMHTSSTLIRAISNIKKNNKVNLLTYNYDQFVEIDYELLTKQKLYSILNEF